MHSWSRPEDKLAKHIRDIAETATIALREARAARTSVTNVITQVENTTILPPPNVDMDAYYVTLEAILPSIPAGAEISGSIIWTSRSLCNHIRVDMSVDSELEMMLLRQPVFDSVNRPKHKVFHAVGMGNHFMREGGALFDYSDEAATGLLHYWIRNAGLSATVPTLLLNKRIPQ